MTDSTEYVDVGDTFTNTSGGDLTDPDTGQVLVSGGEYVWDGDSWEPTVATLAKSVTSSGTVYPLINASSLGVLVKSYYNTVNKTYYKKLETGVWIAASTNANKKVRSLGLPTVSMVAGDSWVNTGPAQTVTTGGLTFEVPAGGECLWDGAAYIATSPVIFRFANKPSPTDGKVGDSWVDIASGLRYKKETATFWDSVGNLSRTFTGGSGKVFPTVGVVTGDLWLKFTGAAAELFIKLASSWVSEEANTTMSDMFFSNSNGTLYAKTILGWKTISKKNTAKKTTSTTDTPLAFPSNAALGDSISHTNTAKSNRKTAWVALEDDNGDVLWQTTGNLATHSTHLDDGDNLKNTNITIDATGKLVGIGVIGVTVDNSKQKWSQIQNDDSYKPVNGATKNTGLFANLPDRLTKAHVIGSYIEPGAITNISSASVAALVNTIGQVHSKSTVMTLGVRPYTTTNYISFSTYVDAAISAGKSAVVEAILYVGSSAAGASEVLRVRSSVSDLITSNGLSGGCRVTLLANEVKNVYVSASCVSVNGATGSISSGTCTVTNIMSGV